MNLPARTAALSLFGLLLLPACGDKDGDDSGGGTADGGAADGGAADGGTADGGDADGGATECFGGNESQFENCMIDNCCPTFSACGGDTDCYNAYSCLLRCTGTFAETCQAECAIAGNAAWDAMATCGLEECGDQVCTYGSAPAE